MKELEKHFSISDEVKAEKPIKKQSVLLNTLHPKKGHTCFEINIVTGEIREAEYSTNETAYVLNPDVSVSSMRGYIKRVLNTKSECVYVTALNKQNALKKYNKTKTNE